MVKMKFLGSWLRHCLVLSARASLAAWKLNMYYSLKTDRLSEDSSEWGCVNMFIFCNLRVF